LAISTLRGQFADNGEWCADPARPAIVVGTIDMIGSRLLFSGYGIGRSRKPLHAGFLGQDTLLVHDEAHLEPAFQELLVAIQKEQLEGRTRYRHPLRVMELTATSRNIANTDESDESKTRLLKLTKEDYRHKTVKERIYAKKQIRFVSVADEKKELADKIFSQALALAKDKSELAILIFVRKVEDVHNVIEKLKKDKILDSQIEQLTGTLRGKERDELVDKPVFQRFLSPSNRNKNVTPEPGTVFLVCTSAGEVGIDISADHMVCDLTPFDSMAQRFGRVNRFGERNDTEIHILYPKDFDRKNEYEIRREKTYELLKKLKGDGSPAAIDKLDPNVRADAFTPEPAMLPATDILFDAWALTTIQEKLPGRPPVEPYLHGIEDKNVAETYIAWREEVWELQEFLKDMGQEKYQAFAAELLDDYPLKPHELLRDSTYRQKTGILAKLTKIAEINSDYPVWIQEPDNEITVTTLKKAIDLPLSGRTVILPPEAGGLMISKDEKRSPGLFDGAEFVSDCRHLYDVADEWKDDQGSLRKRIWKGEEIPEGMIPEREIKFDDPDNEDAEPIKVWQWFVRKPETPNEHGNQICKLDSHCKRAYKLAQEIVKKLELSKDLAEAIVFAAKFHDLGKDRHVWQRYACNDDYPEIVLAKSRDFRHWSMLNGYRHEFGSLLDVEKKPEFQKLNDDMKELVRQLIASHHGRARPHFPADEAFDVESSEKFYNEASQEVPLRFARLQRTYGRWGLAYLESLLRAADWAASADPLATDGENEKEVRS